MLNTTIINIVGLLTIYARDMEDSVRKITEKFPFLTVGKYLDQDYIGIVGNSDSLILSMYVYNQITDAELRKAFLALGEEWWWESHRQIPINIFLGERWSIFRPFLKTFIRKDFEILAGPSVSLQDVMTKRVKRRQIQLVRKIY